MSPPGCAILKTGSTKLVSIVKIFLKDKKRNLAEKDTRQYPHHVNHLQEIRPT
jgi:hypothetical protein